MDSGRFILWMAGVAVILAGAYLVDFGTGFGLWISVGVLLAGLLLFVGLVVVGFARRAAAEKSGSVVEDPTAPALPAGRPTVIERDDRRLR